MCLISALFTEFVFFCCSFLNTVFQPTVVMLHRLTAAVNVNDLIKLIVVYLIFLAQDEAGESTEHDLMNIYGQSIKLADNADELQCSSPANKRQCVNEVLSEIEQNVSGISDSNCNVQTPCDMDSTLSTTAEPMPVTSMSPRLKNKENSPDHMPPTITADISSRRRGEISDSNCMKSPARRKNIFAVSNNAGLRPRFSLDESKVNRNEINTTVEVKSRQV